MTVSHHHLEDKVHSSSSCWKRLEKRRNPLQIWEWCSLPLLLHPTVCLCCQGSQKALLASSVAVAEAQWCDDVPWILQWQEEQNVFLEQVFGSSLYNRSFFHLSLRQLTEIFFPKQKQEKQDIRFWSVIYSEVKWVDVFSGKDLRLTFYQFAEYSGILFLLRNKHHVPDSGLRSNLECTVLSFSSCCGECYWFTTLFECTIKWNYHFRL